MWRTNPLRCARGAATASTSTNSAACALFNNSTGAHLIALLAIFATQNSAANFGCSVSKTRLTNQNVGTISPIVTDEAMPVGQIDTDDLAVAPTADFYIEALNYNAPIPGVISPLAVLRPGWSLILCEFPDTEDALQVGFYYEWCYAEEFLRLSAGDSSDL